jgi:hypothetical protein
LVSHALAAVFNSRAAFHKEWEQAAGLPCSDPVCGRWAGEWVSDQSGHRGELSCVIKPNGSNRYRAHFFAAFSKWFRVSYTTELVSQQKNGAIRLNGEENLGPLAGGTYRSEGEVQGDQFVCHYSCKYDHGAFRLQRSR